jgi:hypothetical protein
VLGLYITVSTASQSRARRRRRRPFGSRLPPTRGTDPQRGHSSDHISLNHSLHRGAHSATPPTSIPFTRGKLRPGEGKQLGSVMGAISPPGCLAPSCRLHTLSRSCSVKPFRVLALLCGVCLCHCFAQPIAQGRESNICN